MPLIDILTGQLSDLFRIGLIIALVITTTRNAAVTGKIIPLIAGVVFVAIIIPLTMQTSDTPPLMQRIGVGVVANLIILGVCWGIWQTIARMRNK